MLRAIEMGCRAELSSVQTTRAPTATSGGVFARSGGSGWSHSWSGGGALHCTAAGCMVAARAPCDPYEVALQDPARGKNTRPKYKDQQSTRTSKMHKNLPLRSAKRHMRRDRQADDRWQRMHQASASRRDANERRTTNRQQAEEVTRQHNHECGRALPSSAERQDAVDAARRVAIYRAPWDLVRRARRILAEGV